MKLIWMAMFLVACGPGNEMPDEGTVNDMTVVQDAAPPDMAMPDLTVETDDPATAVATRPDHRAYISTHTDNDSYFANANFLISTDESFTKSTSGPCDIYRAMTIDGGTFALATEQQAGSVKLTGGVQTVNFAVPDGGFTQMAMGNVRLWQGGESLVYSGSGGDPGTWTAPALTAPAPVTISSPTPTDAGTITISRSQDLHLTWTPGPTGFLTLTFYNPSGVPDDFAICTVLSSKGSLTVPAATLAQMPTNVDVTVSTGRQMTAGAWLLELRAEANAYNASGVSRFTASLVP